MSFGILLIMVAAASAALLHYIVTRAKAGMPYPLWLVWTVAQGAMSISALVAGLSQFVPDPEYGGVALRTLLVALVVRESCVLLFHYFFRGCARRQASSPWSILG